MLKLRNLFEYSNFNRSDNFITDNGEEIDIQDFKTGKVIGKLPRYGVWVFEGQGRSKHEVVETGNNLEYLMHKYNVPKERVSKIPHR
jgi:hypothetical protein